MKSSLHPHHYIRLSFGHIGKRSLVDNAYVKMKPESDTHKIKTMAKTSFKSIFPFVDKLNEDIEVTYEMKTIVQVSFCLFD